MTTLATATVKPLPASYELDSIFVSMDFSPRLTSATCLASLLLVLLPCLSDRYVKINDYVSDFAA